MLISNGRIAGIGTHPRHFDAARIVDITGCYLIPGLWDTHVHLCASAGASVDPEEFTEDQLARALRSYLYHGVTAVVSFFDYGDWIMRCRARERNGEILAPRVFAGGPGFTAPGGHPAGTLFEGQEALVEGTCRQPADAEQARAQARSLVGELQVDALKAVYSDVWGSKPKMASSVLESVIDEGHRLGRRCFVHVDRSDEVIDALNAGADGVEHLLCCSDDSFRRAVDVAAARGATWTPTLVAMEAVVDSAQPDLAARRCPAILGDSLREGLRSHPARWAAGPHEQSWMAARLESAMSGGLRRLAEAGVRIALGTDAGNPAVFHGTATHRELQLMTSAGLSNSDALQSATRNAASKVNAADRLGTIEPGKEADLVVIKSDPLEHIEATEEIIYVIKRGQLFDRAELAAA